MQRAWGRGETQEGQAGPFQTHLSGPQTPLSVDGVSDLPRLVTQAEYPGLGTTQAWAPVPASLLGTGHLVYVTSLPESRFLTHLPMGTLKTNGGNSRRLCHWHLAQRWVPEPLRVEGTSSAQTPASEQSDKGTQWGY